MALTTARRFGTALQASGEEARYMRHAVRCSFALREAAERPTRPGDRLPGSKPAATGFLCWRLEIPTSWSFEHETMTGYCPSIDVAGHCVVSCKKRDKGAPETSGYASRWRQPVGVKHRGKG